MGAFPAQEAVMTMQTSDPKHTGFFQSTTGQTTLTIVVIIAIILLAWRYVF